MTAVAETLPSLWPAGPLFCAPREIPYQTKGIFRAYQIRTAAAAWDTGTGKTVLSIAVACLAAEDGEIGRVVVFCEPNKLGEWRDDFAAFSRLPPAVIYHGPKRKQLLDDLPQILITTYETGRDDMAVFPPKPKRKLADGPLMTALAGTPTMVIYDEVSKFGANRSSKLYRAHEYMLARLRQADPDTRVLGLSATPMETSYDNIFNEMRLITQGVMPTCDAYERTVVRSRHPVYGTPSYRPEGAAWFRDLCAPYILRKRKTDPDVRAQFPPVTEKFTICSMRPDQLGLYRRLEDLAWNENHEYTRVPGLDNVLRLLAADPLAVIEAARNGSSGFTQMAADELGPELRRCSSAKAEQLLADAALIVGEQGSKMIVFTFYGQAVLPVLARRLEAYQVFPYHGGLSPAQKDQAKMAFRQHDGGAILLASDAGARGINIPEASYTIEYEAARTHATRLQRVGRAHRLGKQDPLTVFTYVLERTIEQRRGMKNLLDRNAQSDYILGDDEGVEGDFVSAADRRQMYAMARFRKGAQ